MDDQINWLKHSLDWAASDEITDAKEYLHSLKVDLFDQEIFVFTPVSYTHLDVYKRQVNLFDAVERCSDLLIRRGGHAGAVGVTIEASKLDEFRRRLSAVLSEIPAEDFEDIDEEMCIRDSRMGIARTFQNIRLFNTMTVEDNVKVGLHNQERYSGFEGVLRLPTYWKHEKAAHERAMELLSIFDMEHLANEQAGSLPYGAQRLSLIHI